ncbi:MAG: hypothetical protein R3A10_04670 [Caldilineaceae bacterium]
MTNNLGVVDAKINQDDFTLSVAQHVLGLSDEFLGLTGAAADAERTLRSPLVREHGHRRGRQTVLRFNFTTSLVDNGIFSNVIQQGYNRFWFPDRRCIGQPKAGSNGVGMKSHHRAGRVGLSPRGHDPVRNDTPAYLGWLHLRLPSAGARRDLWAVNGRWTNLPKRPPPTSRQASTAPTVSGARPSWGDRYRRRTGGWRSSRARPEVGLPDLDLQQLTDIQLLFSTTRLRDTGAPSSRRVRTQRLQYTAA